MWRIKGGIRRRATDGKRNTVFLLGMCDGSVQNSWLLPYKMPSVTTLNYKGVWKQAPCYLRSISGGTPLWMSYAGEQQGMHSWHKNAGWLFGTPKPILKVLRWRAKNKPKAKDAHLNCKWDQMKGPTGRPHRCGWVQQQVTWHDELRIAKTRAKWV